MRNFCIHNTRWINRGRELDALGNRVTKTGRPFYLVGDKNEIQGFYEEFSNEITIRGCIHQLTELQREGFRVISPEEAAKILSPEQAGIICVSLSREEYEANAGYWAALGYKENENFFQSELFRMVFFLYKHGEIRLDRVEVFITSYCTLNCEKCMAFIPYFKKREHVPLAALIRDLDILFAKVDFVYMLKVLGGEPLLYPHLVEYLSYLCTNYRKQAGTIRLGVNATILPSGPVMDICLKYDIVMDVSDYSSALPGQCRFEQMLAFLEEHGVRHATKRHGEQWLDLGYPGNPARFPTNVEVASHFHKCAMYCRDFFGGKLYFCCANFRAVQAGLFPANENDYLDFRNEPTKKEILEFETGFSPLGHTTFCNVCRGLSIEANPIRVPLAKQLKANSLAAI